MGIRYLNDKRRDGEATSDLLSLSFLHLKGPSKRAKALSQPCLTTSVSISPQASNTFMVNFGQLLVSSSTFWFKTNFVSLGSVRMQSQYHTTVCQCHLSKYCLRFALKELQSWVWWHRPIIRLQKIEAIESHAWYQLD